MVVLLFFVHDEKNYLVNTSFHYFERVWVLLELIDLFYYRFTPNWYQFTFLGLWLPKRSAHWRKNCRGSLKLSRLPWKTVLRNGR